MDPQAKRSSIRRTEQAQAPLARSEDFLGLAGAVVVPPGKRGLPWNEVRDRVWRERAERRA